MSNKPRPVPSKSALHALGQLILYGSFGTVAGSAVILAEERRRRLSTAKKIAENAKKLRSSSRYAHSLSSMAEESCEDTLTCNRRRSLSRSRSRSRMEVAEKDTRHPLSGEEIDKAYEVLEGNRRQLKKNHKQGATIGANREDQSVAISTQFHKVSSYHLRTGKYLTSPPQRRIHFSATGRSQLPKDNKNRSIPILGTAYESSTVQLGSKNEPGNGGASIDGEASFSDKGSFAVWSDQLAKNDFNMQEESRLLFRKLLNPQTDKQDILKTFYLIYKLEYQGSRLTNESDIKSTSNNQTQPTNSKITELLMKEDTDKLIDCFFSVFRPLLDSSKAPLPSSVVQIAAELLILACKTIQPDKVMSIWRWMRQHDCPIPESCTRSMQAVCQRLIASGEDKQAANIVNSILFVEQRLLKETDNSIAHSIPIAVEMDVILQNPEKDPMIFQELFTLIRASYDGIALWSSKALSRCREFLQSGRYLDAIDLFFLSFDQTLIKTWPSDCITVARELSHASRRENSLEDSRKLLLWTYSNSGLEPTCLSNFIFVADLNEDWYSIAQFYLKHREDVNFPLELRPIIRRSLATSAPYDLALEEIFSLACLEENSSDPLHRHLIRLLGRAWQETQNIAMVKRLFQSMEPRLDSATSARHVRRKFLDLCVKSGLDFYNASDSTNTGRFTAKDDLGALGSLMLHSALRHEWHNVRRILQYAHSNGLVLSASSAMHAQFFMPTLKIYCSVHTSAQTQAFIEEAIKQCGIIPHQRMLECLAERFAKDGNLEIFKKGFLTFLNKKSGYQLHFNASCAYKILKRYYIDRRPSYWTIMSAVGQINRNTAEHGLSSKELGLLVQDAMTYDLRNFRRKGRNSPSQKEYQETIEKRIKAVRRWFPNDTHGVKEFETKMIYDLSTNQNKEAVDSYTESISSGLPQSIVALQIAVEASVRMTRGDTTDATEIIRAAAKSGMNTQKTGSSLIIQQTYHSRVPYEELRGAVMESSKATTRHGGSTRSDKIIAIAAAEHLINKGHSLAAVRLLSSIDFAGRAAALSADIVFMTILLKAYAQLKYLMGIQWVIETVVAKDIRIDRKFIQEVTKARANFKSSRIPHNDTTTGMESSSCCRSPTDDMFRNWISITSSRMKTQVNQTNRIGKNLVKDIFTLHNSLQMQNLQVK